MSKEPPKTKESKKPKETNDQQGQKEPEVLEPPAIVTAAFRSLDQQIRDLDKIPGEAEGKCAELITLVYDDKQKLLEDGVTELKFINAVQALNEEVGHAFHAIMEIDRERWQPESKRDVSLPSMPQIPQLPIQSSASTVAPLVVGQQQPVVKKGLFSDFWEHLSNRRWATAYERAVEAQNRQPEITTSKVIDILSYGRELESEFMRLHTFYDAAVKRVRWFHDENTVRNQTQEIRLWCVKVTGIIRAFSRAIVEYRKERFGDRKVGVAAGAMWVQAAQARAEGNMSIADYYRQQREAMGAQDVGQR